MKPTKKIILNSKKVRAALSSFTDAEMRYCSLQLSLAQDARNIIKEFKLTKEEFCQRVGIPISKYTDYIRGGYNYDLMGMATLQALYVELAQAASLEKHRQHAEKNMTGIVSDRITQEKK